MKKYLSALTVILVLNGGELPAQQQQPLRPHQQHTRPPFRKADPQHPQFGDPLPGLTAPQLAAFNDGKDDFMQEETAEGGLGPIFNRSSCVACHARPAVGGSSNILVTRFGTITNGTFDPLASLGGSLLQDHSILGQQLELVPLSATVVAQRQSTPLFGLGLIEAIPDAVILRNVRTTSVDGVKGRAVMILDVVSGEKHVGRFGWKAQHSSVLAFAADAYLNEMGVTNRFFPTENAPNGDTNLLAQLDKVADPEDQPDAANGKADIDRAADFMRLLAPPPPSPPLTPSESVGKTVFNSTGCAVCHKPQMTTGFSKIAALNFKTINLYSDLLLHDMGSLNDGIAQAGAEANEMKTPPLWGLRASAPYLHDGRAATVDSAIKAHDGEAKLARDRYNALSNTQRQRLLEFLNTL